MLISKTPTWIYLLMIMVAVILSTSSCKDEPDPIVIPPNSFVDIDGNKYKTVTIGPQVWMAENLKVTHYRNGELIPTLKQISWQNTKEGACCDLNDNPRMADVFGKLYNGYAVMDSRNIAPEGWHIPSDAEWVTLINHLGGQMEAGGKMKDTCFYWMAPKIGATNESGFTALPGGCRTLFYVDEDAYYSGYWWSSTECDEKYIYFLYLHNSEVYAGNLFNRKYKENGLSIRCVKD